MEESKTEKYFVNFKKEQQPYPIRIEVTICAPRKTAVRVARELVKPIKGLIYGGTD